MTSRRWLVLGIVVIATVLLAGRVLSAWYVDYHWYAVQGASQLWWERAADLAMLRGAAFMIVAGFVFANLYAVRRSVQSLRLPRRVGNLEFSEEVSARILNSSVAGLSIVLGIAFALPQDDWKSVALMRNGIPFGETDPYFRLDLGTWLYHIPLEAASHGWATIVLVATLLLVIFLYALTPSLRWDGGRLEVSGHVRRHFAVLAGVLLLLLAWSYRLDAFDLLRNGTGASGAFSAVDHRLGIPASLSLAMLAVATAMLVTWTGWIGQARASFVAITVMLLAALGVSQIVPAVGGRFVTAEDPDAQEQSYREIRNAYSRRAYAVDAVDRSSLADVAPSFDESVRGASVWDIQAMRQVVGGPRPGAGPNGSLGWLGQDGRLVAFSLEQPSGLESAESLPAWRLTRIAADVTDDRGSPVTREDPELARTLRGVLVHDSASTYYVLTDTGRMVLARSLDSFAARLAHAWHLQNPGLLSASPREVPVRILLRRDVRERVRHLYPFFAQGSRVDPVIWSDSVYWAVHLYATSAWYPLSGSQEFLGREERYAQLAGVAVVNGHTGRVTTIASPRAGPMAESWMLRFPELFTDPSVFDATFLTRLPPAFDGALLVAHVLARAGLRGEFEARAHLPDGVADSLSTAIDPAPWLNRATNSVSLLIPLLDPTDELRGALVSPGGADFRLRWIRNGEHGLRWPRLLSDLQAAADTFRGMERNTRPLVGAIRLLPTSEGFVAVQTRYVVRPDGAPQVLTSSIHRGMVATTGRTIIDAAGLPNPIAADPALSPEDFRRRVASLYESMREAMRRGDWSGLGAAYEALGRLLRSPPP
jgi:uncharacterized membrane protein (UPF0182 family)